MTDNKQLHLGIIPDGNRRWARKRALQPWKGHEEGVEAFKKAIDWARQNPRIGTLTIWGFSTENWNRSEEEVRILMEIYERFLREESATFHEKKTRLVHSGRSDRIPSSLAQLIRKIAAETASYSEFTLNFALDYGGRDEVVRAFKKVSDPAALTEENFRQYLDHPELPDVDLVIRTSGEQRTSGFFIWQSAYAEWVFNDKYFPDLTPQDLESAVAEYDSRQRRFGK